jgi:hypothetical protein
MDIYILVGTPKPAGQMSLAPPFIQAFTLSEPYISALVQSKDDAVTVTNFPFVLVMSFAFVGVLTEPLN